MPIKFSVLPCKGRFVAFLLQGGASLASTLPVLDRNEAARDARALAAIIEAQGYERTVRH